MQRMKIFIVFTITATIILAVLGVAYAHYVNTTVPDLNGANGPSSNADFWGWLGGCFRWRGSQPYGNYSHQSPEGPNKAYVPPAYPDSDYYPFRFERRCCGW